MLQDGDARDQSSLAQMVNVTQPRMTQILNLLHLAPDIQEAVLFLPGTLKGTDPIHEKTLRPLTAELNWETQRRMWERLKADSYLQSRSTLNDE